MTAISENTVITVGGILLVAQLLQTLLSIRARIAPQPPNQELDKDIARHTEKIGEHERRITNIEAARVACHQNHIKELGDLYTLANAAATAATTANEKLDLLITLTRENKPS